MTSFLFCNFSGFASLQLMRLMIRAQWLLPLDRRFLALPLTQAFEIDSFSVSLNTQAIQNYVHIQTLHSGCRSFRSLLSLHSISSTKSPHIQSSCASMRVRMSWLSRVSYPQSVHMLAPASSKPHHGPPCRNAPPSRMSVSPVCWQSEQWICVRKGDWALSGLTGSSPLISLSCLLCQRIDPPSC